MKIRVTQEQYDAIVGMYEIIPTQPPKPTISQMIDGSALSGKTKEAVKSWIQYRRNGGQAFNASSVNALVDCAIRNEQDYGAEAVCNLISECMSNTYKAIYWDRLDKLPKQMGNHRNLTPTAEQLEHLLAVHEKVRNTNA